MDEARPDPDKLLRALDSSGDEQLRGRLKIYLGMAAGVGKTYAMLQDALLERARGVDVVAGYIEPHGRKETDELAEKLNRPLIKRVAIGGTYLPEFDVDAALTRRPTIILVDELAHSNAPGSRHPKRWQDVEELLRAGISVHTTMNVQHLESLHDVIAQITGVSVQETVPDSLLARADDVELVDLPPRELIQRLKEGKIYAPDRADLALKHFFQEGNLIALRELVLRRTAERVDAQMQHYRLRHAVEEIWPARERIMVCVGPSPMASNLVRAAHRLATSLHAELLAVSLGSPQVFLSPIEGGQHSAKALQLAESLGARTIVRPAQDLVDEFLRIAREENVTSIVIGKPLRSRWREILSRSLVDELVRQAAGISIHVINSADSAEKRRSFSLNLSMSSGRAVTTVAVVSLMTAVCALMAPSFELANLCMVYLAGVTWIASRFSWREALLASVLSVGAFDFFFVPPRFTFAVSDAQYLLLFTIMLAISIYISSLTLRLRSQAQLIGDRERRTASLYELSRVLLSAPNAEVVSQAVRTHSLALFKNEAVLMLTHPDLGLVSTTSTIAPPFNEPNEMAVARWAVEHSVPAGNGTDTLPGAKGLYLPIGSGAEKVGVLALAPRVPLDFEQRSLLDAFMNQVTLALERVLLEVESNKAEVRAQGERLRSTLLSSISHDLRTPLAAISGAASALIERHGLLETNRTELARTIWEESERLTRIVRNVLDLTRLESEKVTLAREWHSLEEIIGSAIARAQSLLGTRKVQVHIPQDLPLVEVDGYLFEQLIINLLENAAKHTPATSEVMIEGGKSGEVVTLVVRDDGPGFADGEEERVFEKLYRGGGAHAQGFGLGLTICRAIMLAHGGTIVARNARAGGAEFVVQLPQPHVAPEVAYDRN